jgi:hypothetical protein
VGTVGGGALRVRCADQTVDAPLTDLAEAHAALGRLFP